VFSYVKFTIILELGIQGNYNLSANSTLTEYLEAYEYCYKYFYFNWCGLIFVILSFEKTLLEEQRDRLRALPLMEENQILGQISANRIVQEIHNAMLVTHYQKYVLNYIYLLIMVSILFGFRGI